MRHRIDLLDPKTDTTVWVDAPDDERDARNVYAAILPMLRSGMLARLTQIGDRVSGTLRSDRLEGNGYAVPDTSCDSCGAEHEGSECQ